MGEPKIADPDAWGGLANRERDRAKVDAYVGEWTSKYDRAELSRNCEKAQVPCGPVYCDRRSSRIRNTPRAATS